MRFYILCFIIFACFFANQAFAQIGSTAICLDYDYSGNRLARYDCTASERGDAQQTDLQQEMVISGKIIPNPNNGHFEVALNQAVPGGKFEIYNTQGDLILEQASGETSNVFDLPDVPSGNYFMILKSPERLLGQWIILKN